eukprot:TRINITY_DN21922_c0_g1_i1.p1 TRINITY_DN21922_c0_g1~~TRINITY_DN21922_c0_g1_i1.p1  ORF type:complete len:115 (+),score=21.20 TRINITY_DN21922_c0_g1_i1:54-398(+)
MKRASTSKASVALSKAMKDRTDWAKVKRLSGAEITARAAEDPEAPERPAAWWKSAKLVMPAKKEQVSLRIDPDVMAFFRESGQGYQSRINAVLRAFMNENKSGLTSPKAGSSRR